MWDLLKLVVDLFFEFLGFRSEEQYTKLTALRAETDKAAAVHAVNQEAVVAREVALENESRFLNKAIGLHQALETDRLHEEVLRAQALSVSDEDLLQLLRTYL